MRNKCFGCSWVRGKWSVGEFSFKGTVGSVCTEDGVDEGVRYDGFDDIDCESW